MPFWRRLLPGKQWHLLVGQVDGLPNDFSALRPLMPPKDHSWADPFPVIHEGRCWVFIEEVIHHPKKGRLAVFELRDDGTPGTLSVILERPYHLSYPHVFEYDGAWWLIPESRANRTVDLYRCTQWPDRWVHEKTLFHHVEIVDATLCQRDGRWWLFGGTPAKTGGSASGQLCLWSADTPLSDQWMPHPANPVVTDPSRARPAGRLFEHEGRLIRPAQDCSVRYGYGVQLMATNEWTGTIYRETPLQTYTPDFSPSLIATHTFNRAGHWLLADAAAKIWPG